MDDDDLLAEIAQAMSISEEHERRLQEIQALEARKKGGGRVQASVVRAESESSDESSKGGKNKAAKNNGNRGKNGKQGKNSQFDNDSSDSEITGVANMEPFMAQMSMMFGAQLRSAVEPLQVQVQELMGFKKEYEKATNGPLPAKKEKKALDPGAPGYTAAPEIPQHKATNDTQQHVQPMTFNYAPSQPANQSGVFRFGFGPDANGGAGFVPAGAGATPMAAPPPNFQEFMKQAMGYPPRKEVKKCKMCASLGSRFCNHCYVCFATEHRFFECPRKDDPAFNPPVNFTPPLNG